MPPSPAQQKGVLGKREVHVGERLEVSRRVVEEWLERVVPQAGSPPTRLHLAMREAVFPGGKRARSVLVQLVGATYGAGRQELVGRMAAAVELVHCASLVHDDLPAFDDAELRRGKPSCHVSFGEATAILVGDALLTLAFETLAQAPAREARTALRLVRLLTEATGSTSGIIGGQGLELQTNVDVTTYHLQKTSALFRAAAAGGALAAGGEVDIQRWARFGELVGLALQLRDDLGDVLSTALELGKPVGRDRACARPNAVLELGETETRHCLAGVVGEALAILGPDAEDNAALRALVGQISGQPLDTAAPSG